MAEEVTFNDVGGVGWDVGNGQSVCLVGKMKLLMSIQFRGDVVCEFGKKFRMFGSKRSQDFDNTNLPGDTPLDTIPCPLAT